jgi:hypothetical protein
MLHFYPARNICEHFPVTARCRAHEVLDVLIVFCERHESNSATKGAVREGASTVMITCATARRIAETGTQQKLTRSARVKGRGEEGKRS